MDATAENVKYMFMFKHDMSFKTITVTQDAYNAIKRMKRSDESFSELFLRVAPSKVTAKDIFGTLSPEDGERLSRIIKENRKGMDTEMGARHKKLWGTQ